MESTFDDSDALLEHAPGEHFTPDPHADLPVYITIHRIRKLIISSIDDPYSLEQLKEPRMNILIVRALVDRLYNPSDVSVDKTPPLDTILESVSLYWLTETFPTSIYPYRERFQDLGIADKPEYYIKKPMGFSWFPKELLPTPVSWVATTGNLVFHRHHTKGFLATYDYATDQTGTWVGILIGIVAGYCFLGWAVLAIKGR